MSKIVEGRRTVVADRDLVVFLIGARINRWWLLPLSLPIISKMARMQKELLADPESGLIGVQQLGTAQVQYWRSLDHLLVYADDKTRTHQPTAKKFYQKLFRNQAVGIWHETYLVRAGQYENIYANMPPTGLARFFQSVEAKNELATARGRLAAGAASS